MQTHKHYLGIDPGWKNLGLALIRVPLEGKEPKPSLVFSKVYAPADFKSITEFVCEIDKDIVEYNVSFDGITIERYVAYKNVQSAETENITMVIGALSYYFASQWEKEPNLVRAIEWKSALVKALFRTKNFDNPSSSLDKKFSIAAADCCMNKELKLNTDHEADAVCLATLPLYVC